MARQENPRRLAHTQNFLRHGHLAQAIVRSAVLRPDDLVVEIGPGRGIITEALARRCRSVIAVEADPRLAAFLRERFARQPNVRIVHGDFLRFDLPRVPHKVFANIPFDITAAVVAKLTAGRSGPEDSHLAVQAEAASRFAGLPRETLVSALLKPSFAPRIVHRFRRSDFVPVPSVDVVLLRLSKRDPPLVAPGDFALYRDFVAHCFTSRTPCLRESLREVVGARRSAELLDRSRLDRDAVPSEVAFDAWLALFEGFLSTASDSDLLRVHGAYRQLLRQQSRLDKIHRTRTSLARRPC